MALRAVRYRCLVNMMATGARDVAQVRSVRIRLILGRLGGNIRITAVTFDAAGIVRGRRRWILDMTGAATKAGSDVPVDQKAVPGPGRRLRIGMGQNSRGCGNAAQRCQANDLHSAHFDPHCPRCRKERVHEAAFWSLVTSALPQIAQAPPEHRRHTLQLAPRPS